MHILHPLLLTELYGQLTRQHVLVLLEEFYLAEYFFLVLDLPNLLPNLLLNYLNNLHYICSRCLVFLPADEVAVEEEEVGEGGEPGQVGGGGGWVVGWWMRGLGLHCQQQRLEQNTEAPRDIE